jgi:hypothetical protein
MNDIESKVRRAISVGHGGMVCRHCLARGGEGKYFFSSPGSLNTSANAVLAHLYKCKEVPDDLFHICTSAKKCQTTSKLDWFASKPDTKKIKRLLGTVPQRHFSLACGCA